MQEKPDFKTSFLAVMEESAGGHLSAEALAAYRSRELAPPDRASVHRHLSACRECAELARDLDLFTEATAEEGNEFEVAAFLRTLKPQLTPEKPAPANSWRLPLAVAASLVFAVAASWWLSSVVTQRAVLAELLRPRANVEVVDLVETRSERTDSPARAGKMAANAGGVLILTPDQPGSFPAYEAGILDSAGALVDTVEDLEKGPRDETFTLWLPPGDLAAGDYLVLLYGISGKSSEEIARFELRVVGRPGAPP